VTFGQKLRAALYLPSSSSEAVENADGFNAPAQPQDIIDNLDGGGGVVSPFVKALEEAASVSLRDLGVNLEDIAVGGFSTPGFAVESQESGVAVAQRTVRLPDQGSKSSSVAGRGFVPANWQLPRAVFPTPPLIEVPTDRVSRSALSLKYYLTDDVCGPAIKLLVEFPLGQGFDLDVMYEGDDFPSWFNVEAYGKDFLRQYGPGSPYTVELLELNALYTQRKDFDKVVQGDGAAVAQKAPAKVKPAQDGGEESVKDDSEESAKDDSEESAKDDDQEGEQPVAVKQPPSYREILERALQLEDDRLKKLRQVVSDYIRHQCEDLTELLDLRKFGIDQARESMIHGDSFANRVEQITERLDDGKEHKKNNIIALQGLNPTAVWIERNDFGQVVRMFVTPPAGVGQSTDLDLERALHVRWLGPDYATYGIPQTLNALKVLLVKDAYQSAAQASAERFALPVRMLKYGVLVRGREGGPIATEKMKQAAISAIESYDPTTGQTMVAPFHWDLQLVGAERELVRITEEIEALNKRILAALGMPSAFLFGDWTNFATAKVQFSGLMLKLKTLQADMSRVLEQRIFRRFCEIRGYRDLDSRVIVPKVSWRRASLESDESIFDFVVAAAQIPGFASMRTLRQMVGWDPEAEEQHLDAEAIVTARRRALVLEQFPSEAPQKMPPGEMPSFTTGPLRQHKPDQNVGRLLRKVLFQMTAWNNKLSIEKERNVT